jgi:hypothetical protein
LNDFTSSRLKLLKRTKSIPFQKYMIQMHMSESDQCPVCKTGNAEEWEHFLLECPALFSASTAPWYYFHATVP